MKSTKVLVVGGGPAGAIAASVLASKGVEVTVIERNLASSKPCGGGIPSVAFEEFGIPSEQIRKEVTSVKLVSPRNDTVEVDLGSDKLMIVDRPQFDSFLRRKAASAGARVTEGSFVAAEKGKKLYSCKIEEDGREVSVTAEYIIAADGVNSRVRVSEGIKPNATVFTISEKVTGYSTEQCEFWFSSLHAPGFYSWVFPAPDGISIGTASTDGRTINRLFEIFRRRVGANKVGLNGGQSRLYKIPIWRGDLYNKGKIIFAGDSAGQVMPLSYEGIYYAMKSGECAAEAVLQGNPNLYKKTWESRFYKAFWFCSRLNEYFLKNDRNAEMLVSFHKSMKVQEIAKNLWLTKKAEISTIRGYIKLLGKVFI